MMKAPKMNVITIDNASDFNAILETEILITHDPARQQDEIYSNMWCIMLSSSYAQKIPRKDIIDFFEYLIKALQAAANQKELCGPITVYGWYDSQAAQLRYNILSGAVQQLPFGCKLHIVDKLDSVVDAFLQQGACGWIPGFNEDLSEKELDKLEEATPENTTLTVFCTYIY